MTSDDSFTNISHARETVLEWVRRVQPSDYPTNEELALNFCLLLPAEVALELRATYNPSSMVYEARWYHKGREVEDFPKPFCAEKKADAEVLACAAMIALPD